MHLHSLGVHIDDGANAVFAGLTRYHDLLAQRDVHLARQKEKAGGELRWRHSIGLRHPDAGLDASLST